MKQVMLGGTIGAWLGVPVSVVAFSSVDFSIGFAVGFTVAAVITCWHKP